MGDAVRGECDAEDSEPGLGWAGVAWLSLMYLKRGRPNFDWERIVNERGEPVSVLPAWITGSIRAGSAGRLRPPSLCKSNPEL